MPEERDLLRTGGFRALSVPLPGDKLSEAPGQAGRTLRAISRRSQILGRLRYAQTSSDQIAVVRALLDAGAHVRNYRVQATGYNARIRRGARVHAT